jgi:hypothetical protein
MHAVVINVWTLQADIGKTADYNVAGEQVQYSPGVTWRALAYTVTNG